MHGLSLMVHGNIGNHCPDAFHFTGPSSFSGQAHVIFMVDKVVLEQVL